MKKKQPTWCLKRRQNRGLTLIEVVAAIAILGTLLVGVVLARSSHMRQLERARVQARAVASADLLIANWWTSEAGVPIDEEGTIVGEARLRWKTRLVENRDIAELGARVVQVVVFDAGEDARTDADAADIARVVIDLVVPDPEVEAREAEHERIEQETRKKLEDSLGWRVNDEGGQVA